MSVSNNYSIIGSDGNIERYSDDFAQVTPELIQKAKQSQLEILNYKSTIEQSYLRLGQELAQFKQENMHLALGYNSFRAWADSPEISIGYRLCMNLIRIVSEVLPILVEHDAIDAVSTVSNMSAILPILADENAEEKIVEAAYTVKDLTNRDAIEYVKEIRGQARDINEATPAIFHAKLRRGESFHTVQVFCGNGQDYYEVGTLRIRPADWPRFEARFGRFIEMVD